MRKPNLQLVPWALILAAALVITGCGGSAGAGFQFTQYVVPDQGPGGAKTLTHLTNNDPNLFDPAKVIADFEDIAFIKDPKNGWTVTGIFATQSDWSGVTSTQAQAARVGNKAVSTCEITGVKGVCDSPQGDILSPPFVVNDDYINFLMTGGPQPVGVELRLASTGSVLLSYTPNSCPKATITDNTDWHHFDVRGIKGTKVQLFIFDHSNVGCGFVSFDHFYMSSAAFGDLVGSVGLVGGQPLSGTNVTLPPDGNTNIIGTFDDAVVMTTSTQFGGEGWLATGDFRNPQVPGAYQGASVAADAAFIGARAMSSCSTSTAGCASLMGTLTSPTFKVTQDYVYFLAAGGSSTNTDVGVKILYAATGEVLASVTPGTCTPGYITGDSNWYRFDVSQIKGQLVKIEVDDNSTAPCGFIAVDHVYQSSSVSFTDSAGNTVIAKNAGLADIPTEFKTFNVSVAPDAFTAGKVIGDFNSAIATLAAGWTGTGIFANPALATSWQGTTRSSGTNVGGGAVSTCEIGGPGTPCDSPTGLLTSPLFTVTDPYLYFLMGGGGASNPSSRVGLRFLDSIGDLLLTYTPNSCGPSYINGNNDWTYVGMKNILNAGVRVQLFDEETRGCGFVSFDHVYQSSRDPTVDDGTIPAPPIHGGDVTPTAAQLKALTYYGVSLPYADSATNVIGDFDDAQKMITHGWVGTGVFAAPASAAGWSNLPDRVKAGRVGAHSMSTCEITGVAGVCDTPTGTLTSPAFLVTAQQPKLSFAMVGGDVGVDKNLGLKVLKAADGTVLASFTPHKCGPPWISVNSDWQTLDLTAFIGTSVQVLVFDNEMTGCGFLAVDHIHMTNGVVADPSAVVPDVARQLVNVTVPADGFDQVIGSFDDAVQMIDDGWVATGVFLNPGSPDAWASLTANPTRFPMAARVGARAVTTCEILGPGTSCDAPIGSLTSPPFKVDAARPKLNFLMSGGGGTQPVGLRVLNAADNSIIATYSPASCNEPVILTDKDWVTLDLAAQAGTMVKVQVFDEATTGCGFVSFDHVHMSATRAQVP